MTEFDAGDRTYRVRVLPVVDQWALFSRLKTILPALSGMDYGLRAEGAAIADVAAALQPLLLAEDDDLVAVFGMVRAACDLKDGEAWGPVLEAPPLPVQMRLTTEVVAENFATFFSMKRVSFKPERTNAPAFPPVEMDNGESWLWRPILRGVYRGEGLHDGTLRIEHIAKANDALDVQDENERRAQNAAEMSSPKK